MSGTHSDSQQLGSLLSVSARLTRAETVETAVTHAIELAKIALDEPVVAVSEYDVETGTYTAVGPAEQPPRRTEGDPDEIPNPIAKRPSEPTNGQSVDATTEVVVETDPGGSVQTEAFVPVGRNRMLRLGTTGSGGFDDADVTLIEAIAANLETALDRLDSRESERRGTADWTEDDATALRRLNELTTSSRSDETIERLLSLGCEYFGLDTGILSHVDGDNYKIKAVVDATDSHEAGAVYDLGDTMCDATLASDVTEPLAFADIADTDHQNHPAAENAQAYIAVPVVVDGDTYGTVNFSMGRPRSEVFRPEEKELIKLIAQWIGTEIDRRHRFEELERYETILETVDDPVYAIDPDGRFTLLNEAAEREFGYGEEVIGKHLSVAMDEADIERIQGQIEELLGTDERSTTAEFELQTEEGERRIVENRLALISNDEFSGTAGVLRDITDRRERESELELFRRAIEEAADGVAVLDDDEYVYIDQTHVDMYGVNTKDDLLGETWRELYDDNEVARLEEVAFPTLESEGHWRGTVTGSRPDGSTFPAELSLTIVDDGRLVCTVRDETERQERKRELEIKERAMNEATVGIQITDPTQKNNPLVYVNDGFERMTGYTSEDAIGRNPLFFLGEDTDPEQVARLREAIASEEPVSLEVQNQHKDGTSYWSRLSVTPVTNGDGVVTNYIGIQQDVTEPKEREQEAQARADLLERIYEVTTDQSTGFEEKINELLEAGRGYLDLPYGFLTQISMDDDPTAGIQTILEATGSHERLQSGESGALSESYCQRTIERDSSFALTNAVESELIDDAAYSTFGLETYIGGNVVVDNDVYGTLCFASREPRESFDEFERSLISLLGQWAGYEIERRDSREELRQQQERLELALSGTNTGLIEWDRETDELIADRTVVDLVGTDVDTAQEFFQAVVHPDERERVRETLKRTLDAGEQTTIEYRVQTADEGTQWLRSRAVRSLDGDGEPGSVLAILTDISARKAEDRRRRENERRFESLFEDPEMLVGLLDTDGAVLDANTRAMEYVEGTAADLQGEPFWETQWWNHSDELQNNLREWIERAADGEYVEYSATHRTPDGGRIYIDGTIRPVTDPDGTVMSLLVSGRDVTERERQRRELRDRQQKLELVLSNTDTSVTEFDLERGTVRWDKMAGDNNIGSPETLSEFFETIHPEDRERVRSAVEAMSGSGEQLSIQFRFVEPDESVVWVAAQAVAVTDSSAEQTEKIVGIATDITELKQREQRLENSQQQMQALHGTTRKIIQSDSKDNAVTKTLDTLSGKLDFHLASVYLRDGDELIKAGTTGTHPEAAPDRVERGRTPLWRAIDTGELVVIEDYTELNDDIDRGETAQSAYVPIGEQGLIVVGTTDSDRLGKRERRVIEVLAGNLASVVEALEREQSLRMNRQQYRSLAENIPNGAVLTFDENLEYVLAAGELIPAFGFEPSDIAGEAVGTVLAGGKHELIPQFRAALNGDRTDRRIELRDRTLRVHITSVDADKEDAAASRGLVLIQDITEEANREQELFEEREQFRLLTESVDEYAFLTVNEEGNIQTWNAGAANLFEYDADVAIGMSMSELHPDSDRESGLPERLLQQTRISGGSADEGQRVRADGSEFYADVRYALLESDDGTFRGYAMVVRDMTDKRRQQRRTERFVEEANDVVTIVDTDGTIEYVSGSVDRILGYGPDDIIGENLFDYLHPESREDAMETFFTGIEEPDADIQTECRIKSGNGKWLNVEGQCRNMVDDDAIGGMLLYLRDVTERKERARRFESIFNQTFQFTGLLEPDGTVIEINDTALDFGGFEREVIVGNPFSGAPWWTHSEAVQDTVRDAIKRAASGEFVRYEAEVRGSDGLATIDFSAKPVRDDDNDVSLLVVEGRDITAQQQHRRHLEVMQRVLRHNIRNDLTKIRGWTQVMSEEEDPAERAEQFGTIERILDKWDNMTEKIADIRQVLHSQDGERTMTEASSLVEDAVRPVRKEYADATVLTEAPSSETIRAPASLLEAVRELADNGADASEDATVEVELTCSEDDWIDINVRDDGPGMPEMEAEVLKTGEETPLNHGQGLGLWMVRTVVTQAGGDVRVESTADGTEVRLRVPRVRTVETERAAQTAE